jgi:hypothetical protein
MQLAAMSEAFDGHDVGMAMHNRQRQTRDNPPSVQENGARSAGALVTTLFRSRHSHPLTQQVQQRRPAVDHGHGGLAIDAHPHFGELVGIF